MSASAVPSAPTPTDVLGAVLAPEGWPDVTGAPASDAPIDWSSRLWNAIRERNPVEAREALAHMNRVPDPPEDKIALMALRHFHPEVCDALLAAKVNFASRGSWTAAVGTADDVAALVWMLVRYPKDVEEALHIAIDPAGLPQDPGTESGGPAGKRSTPRARALAAPLPDPQQVRLVPTEMLSVQIIAPFTVLRNVGLHGRGAAPRLTQWMFDRLAPYTATRDCPLESWPLALQSTWDDVPQPLNLEAVSGYYRSVAWTCVLQAVAHPDRYDLDEALRLIDAPAGRHTSPLRTWDPIFASQHDVWWTSITEATKPFATLLRVMTQTPHRCAVLQTALNGHSHQAQAGSVAGADVQRAKNILGVPADPAVDVPFGSSALVRFSNLESQVTRTKSGAAPVPPRTDVPPFTAVDYVAAFGPPVLEAMLAAPDGFAAITQSWSAPPLGPYRLMSLLRQKTTHDRVFTWLRRHPEKWATWRDPWGNTIAHWIMAVCLHGGSTGTNEPSASGALELYRAAPALMETKNAIGRTPLAMLSSATAHQIEHTIMGKDKRAHTKTLKDAGAIATPAASAPPPRRRM